MVVHPPPSPISSQVSSAPGSKMEKRSIGPMKNFWGRSSYFPLFVIADLEVGFHSNEWLHPVCLMTDYWLRLYLVDPQPVLHHQLR